jgi:membrane complex biogenesis BtpA family protein
MLAGVIHLPPLPGSPRARASCRDVAQLAAEDARVLAAEGYDLAMIENFGDAPFFRGKVPAVTVSAMTACAAAVREACPTLPIGINVLRNDADAALAVAAVCGAACIRVNVHSGARVTDQGIIEGDAALTLRARRALGAESVAIWADVDVKHSAPLAPGSLAQESQDLVSRGMAEALLVTGEGTGKAAPAAKLEAVRSAVAGLGPSAAGVKVLVASGATADSLRELAALCDGVVVGSALRAGGVAGGPVDAAAAASFARAYRAAFGGRAAS